MATTMERLTEGRHGKNETLTRIRRYRYVASCILVWLSDASSSNDNVLADQLSEKLNHPIEFFTDRDECLDFISNTHDEKIFLILSEQLSKEIATIVHDIPVVHSIYILLSDHQTESGNTSCSKNYFKFQHLSGDISMMHKALKKNIKLVSYNYNAASTTILSPADLRSESEQDKLDAMFMYCQLLKEIFLGMEHDAEDAKRQLAEFCKREYLRNVAGLNVINEFINEYTKESAIRWYTRDAFIYRMLNKSLRMHDIEAINKFGFFIKDLYCQLQESNSHLTVKKFRVYRGQEMSNADFDRLNNNIGGLISFNSFLSTSADEETAFGFIISSLENPDVRALLFIIDVDLEMNTSSPVAFVNALQGYFDEEEYLWGMNTIFRICSIQQRHNGLWEVRLSVTSDNDPQLKVLTDYISQGITGASGYKRLAQLMIRMSEWTRAQEIYQTLLKEADQDDDKNKAFLHHQLGYIARQMEDLDTALEHYQQVLSLDLKHMSEDDHRLVTTYSNIGLVLHHKGDLNQALENHHRALHLEEQADEPDQDHMAAILQNIGSILQEQNRNDEALQRYIQVANIQNRQLPPMHPNRARTHNSIAVLSAENGDYTTALTFFENALIIQERSLPPYHIELAIINSNMSKCLTFLGRMNDALKHARKAFDIARRTLPEHHPDLEEFENNILQLVDRL